MIKLTKEDREWLAKQPKIEIGDVVEAMNARYVSYTKQSFWPPERIDRRVRMDFANFEANDVSVVFVAAEVAYVRAPVAVAS